MCVRCTAIGGSLSQLRNYVAYDNDAGSVVLNTAGSALTRIRRRSADDFCSISVYIGPRSDVIYFALKTSHCLLLTSKANMCSSFKANGHFVYYFSTESCVK